MNNILKTIELDLYSPTSYEVIKAQQGDKNSRVIEFVLYDKGEPYEIPNNISFWFMGHRGDGSHFLKNEDECITRKGNRIQVTLLEDILRYAGIIEAKLVMAEPPEKSDEKYDKTVLSSVLSTIPFRISCIKNPCDEDNLSEAERSKINDLIRQAEFLSVSAQDLVDQTQSYAVGTDGKVREGDNEDCAKHYYEQTKSYAVGTNGAVRKSDNEDCAKYYYEQAFNEAATAEKEASKANNSAGQAKSYAVGTDGNVREGDNEDCAKYYYEQVKSYANGTGGYRQNEATDNACYYYEQAKAISESFSGALRPMGTVTFANLPSLANAVEGDMYNISDQFITDYNFKEGSGLTIPAGSNVYKTAGEDGKWDVLAGTPVSSVNGQTGNVNITKADIGLGNVDNTADANKSVAYAVSSGSATKATQDGDGNVIKDSYVEKKVITGGSFNNVIKPGMYHMNNSSDSPESGYEYGLIVLQTGYTSDPYVTQIAFKKNNAKDIYIRNGYPTHNFPVRFYEWIKIYAEGNLMPSDIGALPVSGGTITGNLRLKGSGNYGNVLNFGDEDYVHISEPTDDHMEIKGSYINFLTAGTGSGRFTLNGKDIFTIDQIYPIGSIYMSVNSTDPGTLFGGTWVRWGNGRVPVGVDTSQTEFNTVEKIDGEKNHKLTESEMPLHSHTVSAISVTTNTTGKHTHDGTSNKDIAAGTSNKNRFVQGGLGAGTHADLVLENGNHSHTVNIPKHSTENSGNDTAHNNLPPYITCYMWKRTA